MITLKLVAEVERVLHRGSPDKATIQKLCEVIWELESRIVALEAATGTVAVSGTMPTERPAELGDAPVAEEVVEPTKRIGTAGKAKAPAPAAEAPAAEAPAAEAPAAE